MVKSTRYRIALALLVATVAVVDDSPPLSAVAAGSEGTSISISVPPIMQGFKNTAVTTTCTAQTLGIRTKDFSHLFHFKIPFDPPLQKEEELGEYDQMGKLFLPCFLADKEPLLRMVLIRTTSSRGLKQLRGMHLDIVRVRPDPDRAPGEELFSGGNLVEAVVTEGQLAKLKKMGFEEFEMPEKN
jgi:hypothetical protein